MKYSETIPSQSVPQWALYNVDYDELKTLIKSHTVRNQNQTNAIIIPGQKDSSISQFEDLLYNELSCQHDRVEIFVRSKADELDRRLISLRRGSRFAKCDSQIERCGEDIRCLQGFIAAQYIAFRKILGKYYKWTGSEILSKRFSNEVLGSPKSFIRQDLSALVSQYTDLLSNLRSAAPIISNDESQERPHSNTRLSTPKAQVELETSSLPYWNEYDDASEAGNEPYIIYIDSESDSFPGAKTLALALHKAKRPVVKLKEWLMPSHSKLQRQNLLENESDIYDEQQSLVDTEVGDDGNVQPNFPPGSFINYATFPNTQTTKIRTQRENLGFYTIIGCFAASLILFVVAELLATTGKKKLRAEVDTGVILGVFSSLLFATMGYCLSHCHYENVSWTHKLAVTAIFALCCILNGYLLIQLSD
ncbi:hypothetical protein BGHDH14_bgh05295 [Blumeria hordei DH14]|uniref:SPX domain-containing protein n=1 Tax=Blumeria graminis f. sp. hordei (strain DH14) TaxID=546991 RepID=N1JC37_BLUG1|nr:hypothetical protein BGHDH14_bgh05295 [Blumeria hordei DH14]